MNNSLIPIHFAQRKCRLNWSDLLWAYRREFLTWRDLIKVASDQVQSGSENSLEIELSEVTKEYVWKVSELAQTLADRSNNSEEESKQKWLYICLSWAYERRELFVDPLGEVEIIYANFDYPSAVKSFVRFLPPLDGYVPAQHSQEENHQRLMKNWDEYIRRNCQEWSATSGNEETGARRS